MIRGLEHLSCEGMLKAGVVQAGEEKAPRRPQSTFQYLKRTYKRAGAGLFTRAWNDRTRQSGFKLKENKFRLDIRKKFFTVRVERPVDHPETKEVWESRAHTGCKAVNPTYEKSCKARLELEIINLLLKKSAGCCCL
ncbi:hypothetical protein DUI87_11063 [Hirundo rustica rustica]|uniref:Uncharacterized protein n=1 Tax=Hirundo rustica rustica TaxID=333673 RepID=A0A3M0KFW0_HIRRU|nr:hypothetical protein DUI87_11063 [Hirundo rustica rustica]